MPLFRQLSDVCGYTNSRTLKCREFEFEVGTRSRYTVDIYCTRSLLYSAILENYTCQRFFFRFPGEESIKSEMIAEAVRSAVPRAPGRCPSNSVRHPPESSNACRTSMICPSNSKRATTPVLTSNTPGKYFCRRRVGRLLN